MNDQLKWLYALFSLPNEMLGNQLANKLLTRSYFITENLTDRINNYLTILLYKTVHGIFQRRCVTCILI